MWQKVNPIGMRVWIMKSRPAEWFAKTRSQGADFFVEDIKLRDFLERKLARSGVAKIVIRKTLKEWEIIIFASKVGVLMWKNWEKIKQLEEELTKKFAKPFKVTVKEVRVPELSAKVMAEHIATQLEGRMPYRKVECHIERLLNLFLLKLWKRLLDLISIIIIFKLWQSMEFSELRFGLKRGLFLLKKRELRKLLV